MYGYDIYISLYDGDRRSIGLLSPSYNENKVLRQSERKGKLAHNKIETVINGSESLTRVRFLKGPMGKFVVGSFYKTDLWKLWAHIIGPQV